jgi:hypothetical protein
MPASESQLRATKKYDNDHYFKKLVRFRKEDEEAIRAAAGKSLNGFIVDAVMEKVRASGLMPNHQGEPECKRPFTLPMKAKERTPEEEAEALEALQKQVNQKMATKKAELTAEEERKRDRTLLACVPDEVYEKAKEKINNCN